MSMFKKLTQDLLDLTVEEKGYRRALLAAGIEGPAASLPCSCSTSSSCSE
jgi:hypothetical protein